MTYAAEVLADSPLIYWRLGEASGTAAADSSGNGRNGTYVGSPTLGTTGLLTGDANTAVTLSHLVTPQGVSADATYGPVSDLDPFTIELIVKWSGIADGSATICGFNSLANDYALLYIGNVDHQIHFSLDSVSDSVDISSTPLVAGDATHVVATWSANTAKLYINGFLQAFQSLFDTVRLDLADTFWLGDMFGNHTFDGVVDEVAFYRTALTQERVDAHYAQMLSPTPDTPPPSPDSSQRPSLSLFSDFTAPSNLTPYGTEPAFSIMRGTSSPGLTGFVADAGTFQTTLDNISRDLDPNNLLGPFVVDGVSEVVPGREVAALATWNGVVYPLFFGYADGWPQTYPMDGADLIVDLHATDAFAMLANAQLTLRRRHEYTGARIQAVLNDIGYAGSTDIAHGNSIVGPLRFTTVSALSHLADVGQAEWGEFYVDASGVLFFRDRDTILTDARSSVPQASFVQSPPGLQFNNPVMTEFKPINEVVIVYSDTGKQVTVRDEASIAMPWSRGTPNTLNLSLPFSTSSQARAYARWILDRYSRPFTTFASITLIPANHPGDTDDLWVQALSRELGDLITVTLDPLNDSNPIVRDCVIRGIQHDFQTFPWSTTFYLQDASWMAGLFRLDVSELDGPDVLGM